MPLRGRVQPCVRPHMRALLSTVLDDEQPIGVQGGTLVSQARRLQTSHPAGHRPNHCPVFGTGEFQERGTTL
jgi:hypothetical protein